MTDYTEQDSCVFDTVPCDHLCNNCHYGRNKCSDCGEYIYWPDTECQYCSEHTEQEAAFNAENATHELECRHAIGQHGKDYYMPCHILKEMPDGRLKIQVYGDRYWKDTRHIKKIRYVDKHRVHSKSPGGG